MFWWYNYTAGKALSFQKFTDNNVYIGWNASNDARIVAADTGIFSSGAWKNHILTWNNVTPLSTYYAAAVSKGTSSVNPTFGTLGSLSIGNTDATTGNSACTCALAEFGMWNVVLTAAEISALTNGARPYTIRPVSLLAYYPLDGIQSPEPDISGNALNLTVTGATLAAGPPVMPFSPRWPQGPSFIPPDTFANYPELVMM
jgi:hypothetical protein